VVLVEICSPFPLVVTEPSPGEEPWYKWFLDHPLETALIGVGTIAFLGIVFMSSSRPKMSGEYKSTPIEEKYLNEPRPTSSVASKRAPKKKKR